MSPIDELELELREVLGDRAAGVPVPAGLAERLVEHSAASLVAGGNRPARRWVPVGAAIAGVVAVTVGVVVARVELFGGGSPAQKDRVVVPWDPTGQQHVTTTQYPGASVLTVPAPVGTRQCTNVDLRVVSAHSQPDRFGNGWMATDFVLRSGSATECSVSAYGITTDIVDEHGRVIPNDAPRSGGGLRTPGAWLVRPGQLIAATTGWAHVRGQGQEPATLVILPSNDASAQPDARLSVSLKGVDAPPDPVNPSNVGPWRTGWGSADIRSIADAGSLASLTATLAAPAPASASMGATVRLTVDVANHTDHVVELVPCPTVVVTLTVVPAKVAVTNGTRGPLNCAAAPRSISPGATVRFAAQVVAADVPSGRGSVVWSLTSDGQTLVSTWASLTVLP